METISTNSSIMRVVQSRTENYFEGLVKIRDSRRERKSRSESCLAALSGPLPARTHLLVFALPSLLHFHSVLSTQV